MKMKQFLRLGFVLASILLMAFAVQSFKGPETVAADTIYTYNSADVSEGAFAKTSNWMAVSSAPSCLTTGNRPCNIVVPSGSSLGAQIGGRTNSQVLAIHPSQRKP